MIMLKTWTVRWNGHDIVTENRWFGGAKLYLDSELCDQSGGVSFTTELRGRILEKDGTASVVVAKFRQGRFGSKIVCHVFVNDTWVGGNPV